MQGLVGRTSLVDERDSTSAAVERTREVPGIESIHHQVSAQPTLRPHHAALVSDSTVLTYGELESTSNCLAQRAASLHTRNVPVAVCMSRSPLAIAAELAVLKAGAAFLPLDPALPAERLGFILRDSNVHTVFTDRDAAQKLTGNWQLEVVEDVIKSCDAGATINESVSADDLAYVIYTSGSTGTPKGVEITHGNLCNLVAWHRRAFAITENDRASQVASIGFDAAVWEVWPYLASGATVLFTPEMTRCAPESLRDWMVDNEITIGFVPTPMAERMMRLDWPRQTKLRFLLTGADTLHNYPAPGLPFKLVNNYGPTEATVLATSGIVPPLEQQHALPSVGRPIDGVQVYVCDESLNVLPPGEVGEILIGGASVGKGYRNQPELTAAKFIPDPFNNSPDAHVFCTGDLGSWTLDRQLSFHGRKDDLLKISGYRIEPAEIIGTLNSHSQVQASAVVTRPDGSGDNSLVAYIVATVIPPTAKQLRDHVSKILPQYMVPRMFVRVDELPLTPSGKVARDRLPQPDSTNVLSDESYGEPRTALEEQIANIAAKLLGVPRLGKDDNFFYVGGHSLFGTQFIARIHDVFGVDLSLRTVFESPSAAELAREIEHVLPSNARETITHISGISASASINA